MEITKTIIALDAANLTDVAQFWSDLLGEPVEGSGDWLEVKLDDRVRIAVQHAPDHVAPQWPDGAPQQVHIDLHPVDYRAAHAHALAVGATVLKDEDLEKPDGWIVYADPAGHPFCICW